MKSQAKELDQIESAIIELRGNRVILAEDLARVYGVDTRVLNQAVKRNLEKFPADFMFQLSSDERDTIYSLRSQFVILKNSRNAENKRLSALRSQNVTLKRGQHRKYTPYAFTEHGAIMAANVLNSPRAVQMSVFVVRAFVKMRSLLTDTRTLALKLAKLERELKARLNVHETAIVDILQRVMEILDPAPLPPMPPRHKIGFHAEDENSSSESSKTNSRRKRKK